MVLSAPQQRMMRQKARDGDPYALAYVELLSDVDYLYRAVSQLSARPISALTPEELSARLVLKDLTDQVDGIRQEFTTPNPYQSGSLWVFIQGSIQFGVATETDPTTGVFSLPEGLEEGTPLMTVYVRA